jgi:hypothetical protein
LEESDKAIKSAFSQVITISTEKRFATARSTTIAVNQAIERLIC